MANFYNPYMVQGNYLQELNNMRDRIDAQIQQMQSQQMPQPTNLTQNFQLAPNTASNFRLVNNIEDVNKEVVIVDTYFLSKDNSQMWVKNTRGDIRMFTINEIKKKDDKDILIEDLQKQINELKGSMRNDTANDEPNVNAKIDRSITGTKSSIVPDTPISKAK